MNIAFDPVYARQFEGQLVLLRDFERRIEYFERLAVFAGYGQALRHANPGATTTNVAARGLGRRAISIDRLGNIAVDTQQLSFKAPERKRFLLGCNLEPASSQLQGTLGMIYLRLAFRRPEIGIRGTAFAGTIEVLGLQYEITLAVPAGRHSMQFITLILEQRGVNSTLDQRMGEHEKRAIGAHQVMPDQFSAIVAGPTNEMTQGLDFETLPQDRSSA